MSIFEKISSGAYENKVPSSVEKIPVDEETMTIKQAKAHIEAEKARNDKQRKKHREEDYRLQAQFKRDLEEEYGVAGHPKADKLFSIALQEGHGGGFNDVACCYDTMVELIRD